MRGVDKFYKDWGFFAGDIIRTPLGDGLVTGSICSGKKRGVIAKLKEPTTSSKYTIIKKQFIVLKYKELLEWKKHLSEQGESIFIGTVKSVNLISTNQIDRTLKNFVRR
jgi:hypothetical protein